MEKYVKSISLRAEFSIVVRIAFGYFVFGNVLSIIAPSPNAPVTEVHLRFLLIYEPVVILFYWNDVKKEKSCYVLQNGHKTRFYARYYLKIKDYVIFFIKFGDIQKL